LKLYVPPGPVPVGLDIQGLGPKTDSAVGGSVLAGAAGVGGVDVSVLAFSVKRDRKSDAPVVEASEDVVVPGVAWRDLGALWIGDAAGLSEVMT
jgi:hypothetical protein